jgi:hypothetical protein
MKATIENLKSNREEIISTLKEEFGQENLISAMNILKSRVEEAMMFSPNDKMEWVLNEMIRNSPFRTSNRKVTRTAEILGKIENLQA